MESWGSRDISQQAEKHRSKRTSNACITCRQSKVKCSGNYPCENCQKRSLACEFTDDGRRVTVSERYLRHLQEQAKVSIQPQGERTLKRGYDIAFVSNDQEQDALNNEAPATLSHTAQNPDAHLRPSATSPTEFQNPHQTRYEWASPFTLPGMTLRNDRGTPRKWIWLAPASAGSFSARLTLMMSQHLYPNITYNTPISLDGDVYKLESKPSDCKDGPDLRGVPSLEYSLYLFSTVKFHLSQMFHLYDEATFTSHLREFYQNATQKVSECRIWFIQFLLILAFGKAFLSQSPSNKPAEPPGATFFLRAMSLLPDYSHFWKDPLLAMEVLALAALYLYSVDRKESAYLYIGHAMRIGQLEGLHTELPAEEIGLEIVNRSYNLWWTVYVLDRHLSSSLGLPVSIQDADITTPLTRAKDSLHKEAILNLQVRVSRLLSRIFASLYKSEKDVNKPFLDQTKSILKVMASLARELEEVVETKFKDSIDSLSRGTLHLTLLYHRCVMLAIRPLLLSVLRERLEKVTQNQNSNRNPSTLMNTLVSTGVTSATKTLHVLSALVEHNLLETFLPFDLEFVMGAGTILTATSTLFPDLVGEQTFRSKTNSIMEEIISKGNKVAEVRKSDLRRLESLFEELTRQESAIFHNAGGRAEEVNPAANTTSTVRQAPDLHDLDTNPTLPGVVNSELLIPVELSDSDLPDGQNLLGEDFLANFGLSSDSMLSVVDQIGYNDDLASGNISNEWIWETS